MEHMEAPLAWLEAWHPPAASYRSGQWVLVKSHESHPKKLWPYMWNFMEIYILGWIGLDSIKLDEVDGWIDRLNEIDRILGIELSLIPRNMASCKS